MSAADGGALSWVRPEIDASLREARLALEQYTTDPADEGALRHALTWLHQVAGTLEMVELTGAARLARENEALARALLEGQVPARDAAVESLVRGLLTLPEYLARLDHGAPDSPLPLLSLINALRTGRGETALEALDLFDPDLSSVMPPRAEVSRAGLSEAAFTAAARARRSHFQAGLLDCLRTSRPEAFARLATSLSGLARLAHLGPVQQVYWVASAFTEALAQGALAPDVGNKKLLGRIDQVMRLHGDPAAQSGARGTAEDLVRRLLFALGPAQGSAGPVGEVRRAFALDRLFSPEMDEAAVLPPSPETLAALSGEVTGELVRAQEAISLYFDPLHDGRRDLSPARTALDRMLALLRGVGARAEAELVQAAGRVCAAIAEGGFREGDAAALPLAAGLIRLERAIGAWGRNDPAIIDALDVARDTLNRLLGDPSGSTASADDTGGMMEADRRGLVAAVATEVRGNIARVEEILEAHAASVAAGSGEPARLDPIARLLSQVQGAFDMLGAQDAARLAAEASADIERLKQNHIAPTKMRLDALAVSVGALGAAIEDLIRHPHGGGGEALEIAWRDLLYARQIETGRPWTEGIEDCAPALSEWMSRPHDMPARARLAAMLHWLSTEAVQHGDARLARIGEEMRHVVRLLQPASDGLPDEIRAVLEASLFAMRGRIQDLSAEGPSAPDPEAVVTRDVVSPVVANEPNSEIVEFFLEDVAELTQVIDDALPRFRARSDDQEALLELRRAYHTLKGSGRLAGATRIAEFSAGLENMLNRVRDGKVSVSAPMFELLETARITMPHLVEELRSGVPVAVDVEGYKVAADAFSRGEMPATLPAALSTARDPALVQIFCEEALGHLAELRSAIESSRTANFCVRVSEPVLRATHTLLGNARALDLDEAALAAQAVESRLQHALDRNLPIDAISVGMMNALADGFGLLTERLASGGDVDDALRERLLGVAEPPVVPIEAPAEMPAPEPLPSEMPAPEPVVSGPVLSEIVVPPLAPAVDPELLEIFLDEAVDLLATLDDALTRWRSQPAAAPPLDDIKRTLHTLKGGARMAGVAALGTLAHNTESALESAESGKVVVDDALLELLSEIYDHMVGMSNRLRAGQPIALPEEINRRLTALLSGQPLPGIREGVPIAEIALTPDAAVAIEIPEVIPDRRGEPEEATPAFERTDRRGQVRVRTSLLNTLSGFAGEVSIARSRMEQQFYGFRENLQEMTRNVARFRDQLRELEIHSESQILYRAEDNQSGADFDPLEFDRFSRLQQLSRGLSESLHDLGTIHTGLENFFAQAQTTLHQQARLNTELQEGLMRTRMIGFATQSPRLRHMTRTTARELGKQVDLEFTGASVEVDRDVLERMIGPFEHMIRNSIDHGIEPAAERARQGKPTQGSIRIETRHEGNDILIRFEDDGRGLDIAAIRAKAESRGLIVPGAQHSDEEIIQFILMPGFSTAQTVTQLSGRGVGMDVVHTEIKRLGGSLSAETRAGQGTTFLLRLPVTLSIMQALMTRAGEEMYAIPLAAITQVLEVPVTHLGDYLSEDATRFNYQGESYPFVMLAARLGIPSLPRSARKTPILFARAAGRVIAVQADGLVGAREVVVKALGPQLAQVPGLAGGTVLGDGRVVLILDVGGLAPTDERMQMRPVPTRTARASEKPAEEGPRVLVVDDSITVRKVTSRLLTRNQFSPDAAKDGVDALERIRARCPDLILLDIEMPRMDGFELLATLRGDAATRHVPVIMITSRSGAKHRERAMELGATHYLTKPYQEDELLGHIRRLLPVAGRA